MKIEGQRQELLLMPATYYLDNKNRYCTFDPDPTVDWRYQHSMLPSDKHRMSKIQQQYRYALKRSQMNRVLIFWSDASGLDIGNFRISSMVHKFVKYQVWPTFPTINASVNDSRNSAVGHLWSKWTTEIVVVITSVCDVLCWKVACEIQFVTYDWKQISSPNKISSDQWSLLSWQCQ